MLGLIDIPRGLLRSLPAQCSTGGWHAESPASYFHPLPRVSQGGWKVSQLGPLRPDPTRLDGPASRYPTPPRRYPTPPRRYPTPPRRYPTPPRPGASSSGGCGREGPAGPGEARVAMATARGWAMPGKEENGQGGALAEMEKKIIESFEVFDHEGNKTVHVREIGLIVRSLGCFPTEAELQELLAKVEEEPPTGYIHLEKFLPVMTEVLLNRSYQPIPEDVLLHAFEVSPLVRRKWRTCCPLL
ncbi:dynein regulatory complex protein 8 isoform X3 [Pogoniulus pusillus]|uniref:dynein regulatory complex protein 8 isoform X3 n=1 Tax=Pogoniulus pusillus TaxID=488313 RepID=UPI0030B94C98